MGRPLRIDRAGGCCHVTARGNERRDIYRDEADQLKFLELVRRKATRLACGPGAMY